MTPVNVSDRQQQPYIRIE